MKKKVLFFVKALLMLCLVVFFLFGIVSPQYELGYNASILDKVARLKEIEGSKIVLIGDSNLAFGIDSSVIEEQIGMPVVNMGLHGGLGNAFHERMARLNVQEGDIYVISHTAFDDDDSLGDPSLIWVTLENHLPLYQLVRAKDWWTLKDALSNYVQKSVNLWLRDEGNEATEDAYSRLAFNEYGDNVYPRAETVEGAVPFESQTIPGIGDLCVERMNALNAYLTERGASMVVTLFPIANVEFTPSLSDYFDFQETLEARLDAPVISFYDDYLYDYYFFYDTIYHLTDEGVQMRTEQLVRDLQAWMEGEEEV